MYPKMLIMNMGICKSHFRKRWHCKRH